jgi:hypothetical protein
MELKSTIPQANSISRAQSYPLSQDYNALLERGYELIARYSGELWTNYNDSDPGITILQNLCYALTELGNKAGLPVSDILADKDGRISYKDHFHTPQQILPTNPVTCADFSKVILDALPEVKQVYSTPGASFPLSTTLMASLEVKPAYAEQVLQDISFVPFLQRKALNLFRRHGNMAQVFTMPAVLSPVMLELTGIITVGKDLSVEEVIAGIIYAVNDYLSPYPVYKSYQKLVSSGRSLSSLLEGPWLPGGYIEDSDIVVKRTQLTTDEVSAALLAARGVEGVVLQGFSTKKDPAIQSLIRFGFDEAPFLSSSGLSKTTIVANGRRVTNIDDSKVQYYLNRMIPVQQGSDLSSLLPGGEYRNTGYYYSIQNSFPSVYQLTGNGPSDPAHQAKVKQLKAYLVLFEQLMADHLAQLEHLPDLFSFECGRTGLQLTSATYFSQPLYDVPGIGRVLKGVNGSKRLQDQTGVRTDWRAYTDDAANPYALELTSRSPVAAGDLSRKRSVLEHLLARCGQQYDHQPLRFMNQEYGPDPIAEVEYLKQTLQEFPLLSANHARTYFNAEDGSPLATGLERTLENELGLRSFYTGMTEALRHSLEQGEGLDIIYYDDDGPHIIYPAGEEATTEEGDEKKRGVLEVLWNDRVLFSFSPPEKPPLSMDAVQAGEYLKPYLSVLTTLSTTHYGCIVIDCARLADFLRFRWTLKTTEGKVLYVSGLMSFSRFATQRALIDGTLALEIKKVNNGSSFEVGVTSGVQWYLLCADIASEVEAQAVVAQLRQQRQDPTPDAFILEIADESNGTIFPASLLFGRIAVFFPEWISLYHEESFHDLLNSKLLALAPATAVCSSSFLPISTFTTLLTNYQVWLAGVEALYEGNRPEPEASLAAVAIVKTLNASCA